MARSKRLVKPVDRDRYVNHAEEVDEKEDEVWKVEEDDVPKKKQSKRKARRQTRESR